MNYCMAVFTYYMVDFEGIIDLSSVLSFRKGTI